MFPPVSIGSVMRRETGGKTFLFQSNLQLAHDGVVGAFLEALSFCYKPAHGWCLSKSSR